MAGLAYENGTWEFDVNNTYLGDTVALLKKDLSWELKVALAGFTVWSVVGSSDSSTVKQVGDQSPDLWLTDANVVSSTGAHSWIVFENSVTGEQLLLDLKYASTDRYWYISLSPGGLFTTSGATTSVAPTATDEIVAADNTEAFMSTSGTGTTGVLHTMVSGDGKCLRIAFFTEKPGWYGAGMLYLFDSVYGTSDIWTATNKKCVYFPNSYSTGGASPGIASPKVDDLRDERWYCNLKTEALSEASIPCFSTVEGYGAVRVSALNQVLPLNGDGYPLSPIGLFRPSLEYGGSIGRLKDIYWMNENHAYYDTYAGPLAARGWLVFGAIVLPWDGSVPTEPW